MSTIGQHADGVRPSDAEPAARRSRTPLPPDPERRPPVRLDPQDGDPNQGTHRLSAYGPDSRRPRSWEEPPDGRSPAERAQADPEFVELRRRMRRFTFPMAALFLLWYFAYVLLASYAPDLMATPVLGRINLGLLVGLAQFVTTFALTTAYVRYADRRLDPLAVRIRERLESPASTDGADAPIWSDR